MKTDRDQPLNQLAFGMAHEFNNFLAAILGSAELAALDLPDGHPARESLEQVVAASHRARNCVNQLQVFAQRSPPEFAPVDFQTVIQDCLHDLRQILPTTVEVQARIGADCPELDADAAQIQQAILNLCLHAWRRLPAATGQISISIENGHVIPPTPGMSPGVQNGPHLCLTVQDNGPKPEPRNRERIFQPFRIVQADGTKAGLELFLAREIIHEHRGEISVDDQSGEGLAFRIYLPVVTRDA
jgi:signal transduction histidine kinase